MRLDKKKHLAAEQRVRTAILTDKDYPGKAQDIALIRRKQRELGQRGVRRLVRGGGWG
jgi:hypothetical protein